MSDGVTDYQQQWDHMIGRIKKCGAGTYGTKHFMCQKHEHWKFLWADERIAKLEQQLAELREYAEAVVETKGGLMAVSMLEAALQGGEEDE